MRRFIKVKTDVRPVGSGKNKTEKRVVYPEFAITGKDIMRKGGNFYAVLDPKTNMWLTDIKELYRIIDEELYSYTNEHFKEDGFGVRRDSAGNEVTIRTIDDSSTKVLLEFNKWFNNLPPNHNYIPLDSELTFKSDEVTPDMYRSKRLPYDLVDGDISAYEKIVSTLYSPEDREKLEWAIGAVLSGDSKKIEKFIVLYGSGGTGKSTMLDLIQVIFDGYWAVFVAEELANKSHQFATAAFKDNPLLSIQDDGSLAKIDSPRINEIVSHKPLMINEKNTKQYQLKPQAMLFLATNDKVDMHDTNLGITRRLLDVYPTGNLIPVNEYRRLVNQMMKFEVPAIAKYCLDIYMKLGKEYYAKYVPRKMIEKTNYIFNFLFDYADELEKEDPITRDYLYTRFKSYCEDSGFIYIPKRTDFCDQVKPYYERYNDVGWYKGRSHRHVLSGFKIDMFMDKHVIGEKPEEDKGWLEFNSESTVFDDWCKDKGFKAQYPKKDGTPKTYWSKVNTTMEDINRSELHYILIPEEEGYLRLDFDLKDENGNKCLEKNIKAANEYPPTYAEISKSGGGVHLYYIYDGDQHELPQYISPDIEIKTTYGIQPIRRKFTKCNDMNVATLHVGSLPVKERRKDVVDIQKVKDDKHLRNLVVNEFKKKANKKTSTNQACNFIYKVVEEEAYKSGVSYDIRDLEKDLRSFANNSSNHSTECTKLFAKMHLCSDDMLDCSRVGEVDDGDKPIVIFDVEVFPNVFIICWKILGDNTVFRLINPRRSDVAHLIENYRLVGFNNRKYDNHIIYAYAYLNYSNYELYVMSQSIIVTKKGEKSTGFIGKAYNVSYLDLYDLASNPNKKSLKKWEIQLHAHHQENAYDWNEDLPEDKWEEVADYCENDVRATELVYHAIAGDVAARLILSAISGLLPNDTTNNQSMQIIFGDDKHPQEQFIYTDLSIMHPGYEFKDGVSRYKGYEVGEGGLVWALPGMYRKVKTFDVASMHPSSLIFLNLFGPVYTQRFKEIKDARLAVKHKDREALKTLLGGTLLPFYDVAVIGEEYTLKDLANALKTVINSVYGLTAAKFENRCRDPRNVDNIVAKAGALFMVDLKEEVEKRGGKVVHIKTDSIKVVNPTPELEQFIIDFGKQYGYDFEVESVYDRFCLVNDAVYIAKEESGEWTATGAEFAHPYIFKTLFSHEEIDTYDLGEVKNVSSGELYLDFNEGLGEEHNYQFIGKISEFLPVKDGVGGAELMVKRGEKYSYVSGTKGIRWMEAEFIRDAHKEDYIDMNYYDYLCVKAKEHISEFGDFDRFVYDDDYDPELERCINVPIDEDCEVPFDEGKVVLVA